MVNAYLIFEEVKNNILVEASSSTKKAKECIRIINNKLKPLLTKQLVFVKDNNKKAFTLIPDIIELLMKIDNLLINTIEDMNAITIDADELNNYIKHIQYAIGNYISSYSVIAQEQSENTYTKKLFKDIFKNGSTIWGNMLKNTVKHISDKGKELVSQKLTSKANIHKVLSELFTSIKDVARAIEILEVILNQYINKQG